MFLSNSNQHFFYSGNEISEIKDEHQPYFLLNWEKLSDKAKADLEKYIMVNNDITSLGEVETYKSSTNFTKDTRQDVQVKKVFCNHPKLVPTVSDDLFQRYRKHGVEMYQFDIPYRTLVLLESAAKDKYMFNTDGNDEVLKILTYDIETLKNGTICIIGYSEFQIKINSSVDLETENLKFEIIDYPNWEDVKVEQLIAKQEEEHKILFKFIKIIMDNDIIAGHNIFAFDNLELINRIKYNKDSGNFNKEELEIIDKFLKVNSNEINIFNFGKQDKGVLIYPQTFDTLFGAKRLYTNLESYTLKSLAKEFNFIIENRTYFNAEDFNKTTKNIFNNEELFQKFIEYNKHDVMEQNALTILFLQQILPFSFLSCLPLDEVVIKSNTKVGDSVSILRSIYNKQIFPPVLKANVISEKLIEKFNKFFIINEDIKQIDSSNKELLKVAKYGEECPQFCHYPGLILYSETVGGLTVHPSDDEGSLPSADSNLLLWYNVIQPDVGYMYPAFVLAKNACSDSIRFCLKTEEPDDYIWIKNIVDKDDDKIMEKILKQCPYIYRTPKQEYQSSGIEFGIIINKEDGMLTKSMGSIVKLTSKIKKQKKLEIDRQKQEAIKGLYSSLKAVRNALTHGMVLAFAVGCRGSNLASGSLIVTYGNKVMFDIYNELKKLE